MTAARRAGLSLAVLAGWLATTLAVGMWMRPGEAPITEAVTRGVGWNFVAASLFLAAAAAALGGRGFGLGPPRPGTLRLLWLPGAYVALMAAAALAVGLPPWPVVGLVVLNTAFVGFSEELMFRGVLWWGLRPRLGFWPAAWTSAGLFGAVHLLNAFATGAPGVAALQALVAFLNGLHFVAVRVRCRSVWPGVAVHAAWNCAALLILVGAAAEGEGAAMPSLSDVPPAALALPFLMVMPLFLYGLFLLRRGERAE